MAYEQSSSFLFAHGDNVGSSNFYNMVTLYVYIPQQFYLVIACKRFMIMPIPLLILYNPNFLHNFQCTKLVMLLRCNLYPNWASFSYLLIKWFTVSIRMPHYCFINVIFDRIISTCLFLCSTNQCFCLHLEILTP